MAARNKKGTKEKKGKNTKGKVSREKVLAAARSVFSMYSYSSASLRMIAREGGFDSPLIHYYFKTKADLFAAALSQACEELQEANKEWFDGLDGIDPARDLAVHLDRILEYDLLHPESFRILYLNLSELHRLGHLPGMELIPLVIASTLDTFLEHIPFIPPPEEAAMLNNAFINVLISYLGAKHCQAMVLDMDPMSRKYREWVKEALLSAFAPWLENLAAISEHPKGRGA